MNKKQGRIISFDGGWDSGLAELTLQDELGRIEAVFCDNGPTVRALASCFSDEQIIGPNHCVNVEALRGKEIFYQADTFNVLEWFAPVEPTELQIESKGI